NRYLLPRVEEIFDQLGEAAIFSKLDLRSGYHQVRIADEDIEKTACRSRDGHAPATFMCLMHNVFRDFLDQFVIIFIDDILIYSKSFKGHAEHLRQVFTRLREHRLFVKHSKCEFAKSSIPFLGHVISHNHLAMDLSKLKAVQDWKPPTAIKDADSQAICVPADHKLHHLLLREHHDQNAHFGVDKTPASISANFFWPKLSHDIRSYIRSCHACQCNKARNAAPYGLLHPLEIHQVPWSHVTLDFITDLPHTSSDYNTILTVVDKSARWLTSFLPVQMQLLKL
ncbi:hypothetical protein CLOM_g10600, partial [Closterium sp. NIES-68]